MDTVDTLYAGSEVGSVVRLSDSCPRPRFPPPPENQSDEKSSGAMPDVSCITAAERDDARGQCRA